MKQSSECDKITILVIDDAAFSLDTLTGEIWLPAKWEPYFRLYWIQNSYEARQFIDDFYYLSSTRPLEASDVNLPAEILIFDYALTGEKPRLPPVNDRRDVLQPLKETVIKIMDEVGTYSPIRTDRIPSTGRTGKIPSTGAPPGADRTGCYVGVEIAKAFEGHPCGCVPTTAKVETRNTDAGFFEWLNERYFLNAFASKERYPSWKTILPLGLDNLRENLIRLTSAGQIVVSVADLFELISDPLAQQDKSLTIRSRFGIRNYPIKGLFADFLVPYRNEPDIETYALNVREWAERMINALLKRNNRNDLTEAANVARKYYSWWSSDACLDREELTVLITQSERTAEEELQLDQLCVGLDLEPTTVRNALAAGKIDSIRVDQLHYLPSIKDAASGKSEVARWAVLMLMVRLEVAFNQSVVECQDDESLPLRMRKDSDDTSRIIDTTDIYSVLEPAPRNLLMWFARSFKKGEWEANFTHITQMLKRLGENNTGWGTFGISLDDVLGKKYFNCNECRRAIAEGDRPSSKAENHHGSHGLREGEGHMLRCYAASIGFTKGWPSWFADAP